METIKQMNRGTIIYTRAMLDYLIRQGFLPIVIIEHPTESGRDAWVFISSPELNIAMSNYSKAGEKSNGKK